MQKIFQKNPKNRLGTGSRGASDIKSHPFFSGIDWESVYAKKIKPPFMPKITKPDETRYIHDDFLDEPAIDSFNKDNTLNSKTDIFMSDDFSYKNK